MQKLCTFPLLIINHYVDRVGCVFSETQAKMYYGITPHKEYEKLARADYYIDAGQIEKLYILKHVL